MARNRIAFSLVAFAASASLRPCPSASASSLADHPGPPSVAPVPRWGHPPEAVRNAATALHDACAAWPKLIPLASGPSSPLPEEAEQPYVSICNLALDPAASERSLLLLGAALGATAAGIAAVVFKVAKLLLFGLGEAASRGLGALRERRRRRIHGLPG